ncbi:MAG TPA: hypothetical protein VFP49_09515 [Nitrososphaeraceae archaeon]|nr:hypothetical protein [Nitrososphaeraceae archaeon]
MLGDLFYEARGRITSKRVLDLEGPKTESSYSLEGKMRGKIEVVEIGTFTKTPISDGYFFVEGKDIVTVKGSHDDDEMATVRVQGISKLDRRDSSSKLVSGSNFYRSSPNGKLSFLNNLVGVHEASVDKDGNILYKVWEWKHPA